MQGAVEVLYLLGFGFLLFPALALLLRPWSPVPAARSAPVAAEQAH
ncbi:MAG: hypothetical protein ACLQDY_06295 [Streptosporangiaceae bacterium]